MPLVWQVPEEVPIALLFNSSPYAVMMGTPKDLEDFASGFALAEGIVSSIGDIRGVLILPGESGVAVDISADPGKLNPSRMVQRSVEGRTGCGLCGVENIKDVTRLPDRRVPQIEFTPAAILEASQQLPSHQAMNAVNHTVHAAAWCDLKGRIHFVREDVGRHNALDKLVGALARQGMDARQGFVLMSSRCSFELVQKCAVAGIGGLATVSAPTALALTLARQTGLKLAALSRNGVMMFDEV